MNYRGTRFWHTAILKWMMTGGSLRKPPHIPKKILKIVHVFCWKMFGKPIPRLFYFRPWSIVCAQEIDNYEVPCFFWIRTVHVYGILWIIFFLWIIYHELYKLYINDMIQDHFFWSKSSVVRIGFRVDLRRIIWLQKIRCGFVWSCKMFGLESSSPKSAAQAYACEAKHAWILMNGIIFLTLLTYNFLDLAYIHFFNDWSTR